MLRRPLPIAPLFGLLMRLTIPPVFSPPPPLLVRLMRVGHGPLALGVYLL